MFTKKQSPEESLQYKFIVAVDELYGFWVPASKLKIVTKSFINKNPIV